jgi:predicted Zn-dependent protease
MRFISLSWTDNIPKDEVVLIVQTVYEALIQARQQWPEQGNIVAVPEIKPFGYWVLQGASPNQEYGSMQWYIDNSFDQESYRLLGRRYLQLVLAEPWQQQTPHYDLAVVHQPLLDEVAQHNVFGVSTRGRAAVFSVHLLQSLDKGAQRYLILRRLVAHYLGQMIGIPIPGWREETGHPNPCAMRPVHSLAELIEYTEEESRARVLYCQNCQHELGAKLASNHFGMN